MCSIGAFLEKVMLCDLRVCKTDSRLDVIVAQSALVNECTLASKKKRPFERSFPVASALKKQAMNQAHDSFFLDQTTSRRPTKQQLDTRSNIGHLPPQNPITFTLVSGVVHTNSSVHGQYLYLSRNMAVLPLRLGPMTLHNSLSHQLKTLQCQLARSVFDMKD